MEMKGTYDVSLSSLSADGMTQESGGSEIQNSIWCDFFLSSHNRVNQLSLNAKLYPTPLLHQNSKKKKKLFRILQVCSGLEGK